MNDLTAAMSAIDLTTASIEDLENLSLDDLLGARLDEVDFSNLLPTGTYVFQLDLGNKSLQECVVRREAKPAENKKASLSLNLSFRVVKVLACADSDIDQDSLVGRFHNESFSLLNDFGKRNLATWILGVLGLTPKDKDALAGIGKALVSIVDELREMKVTFGAKIKREEKNGFDNARMQFKLKDMVSAESVVELLD